MSEKLFGNLCIRNANVMFKNRGKQMRNDASHFWVLVYANQDMYFNAKDVLFGYNRRVSIELWRVITKNLTTIFMFTFKLAQKNCNFFQETFEEADAS